MAESVEGRMQEMIPIWDKIKQTGLLSPTRLTKWITGIRQAELSIQKPARTTQDFFDYLNKIKQLLKELSARREAKEYTHNKREIEELIQGIIFSRVGMGKHNFKLDPEFWEFIISYFKDMGWNERVSNTYSEVLKLFGTTNSSVYSYASLFEWEKSPGRGIEQARILIQHGLREHPKELNLYIQAIYLECLFTQYLVDCLEDKQMNRDKIHGVVDAEPLIEQQPLIRCFYKEIKEQCKEDGVKLYAKVYGTLEPYDFAKSLKDEVLVELKEAHPEDEATYHFLAKTVLKQTHGQFNIPCIQKGIEIYEEGLRVKPTLKMREHYFRTLETFYKTSVTKFPFRKYMAEALLEAFTNAHIAQIISVDIYMSWFKLVSTIEKEEAGDVKKSGAKKAKGACKNCPARETAEKEANPIKLKFGSNQILEFGLQFAPNNWKLLGEKLDKIIKTKPADFSPKNGELKKTKAIMALFREIHDPEGKSLEVWTAGFLYLTMGFATDEDNLFKFIMMAPMPIQFELTRIHIEDFYVNFEDEMAMKYYKAVQIPGFTGNLHMIMAELESRSAPPKERRHFESVAQLHELSVRGFGKNDLAPWKSYMKFENETRKDPGKVSKLYERALKVISPDLKEELMNMYQELGSQ